MNHNQLLFATDFSHRSLNAFRHSCRLAIDWNAKLNVLYVKDPLEIVKPFDRQIDPDKEFVRFIPDDIAIDFAQHRVTVDDDPVKLTPTEYRLLTYMASNANRVIMHRELLRAVWGPEYGEETEYLRVYIRYLRQKLEPDPSHPRYLLTQPGAGYMLHQPEEDK